jgi:eukaryotic-like serine/threonine-protein kinase
MGRVWLGHDEVLRRDVAVKEVVPPAGLTAAEQDMSNARSLREARAIARLNHPNVVRIYDVVNTQPYPWIVMEYVPSRSLHQVISEDGPLAPAEAARVGLAVLSALVAAHRSGIVHRDVKPSNVLLSDTRVVLTDWGLATMEGDATVTRSGMIIGSPAYISPERAREGTSGPASDLWSLGATLYAAVEGRSPYERSSAIATLTALATEEPDPANRAGALRPVLNGLLRKDPAARIDAVEAERLLRKAMGRPKRIPVKPWRAPRPRIAPEPPPLAAAPTAAVPAAAVPAVAVPPAAPAPDDTRVEAPADDTSTTAEPEAPAEVAPESPEPVSPEVPAEPASAEPTDVQPTDVQPTDAQPTDVQPTAGPTSVLFGTGRAAPPVPPPARDDDEPGLPLGRGGVVLLAALLVLALVGIVVFAATHRSSGTAGPGPATSPKPGASAGSSAAASTAPSAAPPTQAPTQASTAADTGGGTPTLPAGWHYYSDPTGFTVAAPDGWTVSHKDTRVTFHDPAGGRLLIIDQRDDPQPDPVADWQDQERRRVAAGNFPEYERIGIRRVDYHLGAADWEFRFTDGGVRVHVINRGAIFGPHQAYGFYWSTPDDQWDANLPNFDLITRTFQGKTD